MITVIWNGSYEELKGKIQALNVVLSGGSEANKQIAIDMTMAIGYAALASITDDFIVKSRKGIGQIHGKWAPLSPRTIAYRKVGKKDMDDPAIATREKLVKQFEKLYYQAYLHAMPEKEARAKARRMANLKATAVTGKTKVETLGNRDVEILRDTGRLLNSLTPGVLNPSASGWSYDKPSGIGGSDQKFEAEPGSVIIGTNVEYASKHMTGTSIMPARPFLPTTNQPPPNEWIFDWQEAAKTALKVSLTTYFIR